MCSTMMIDAGRQHIRADLKVAITGTDADWVVKVIDVYPDSTKNNQFTAKGTYMSNYERNGFARSEEMRGKYRNDISKPEPFVPGQM